jgi:hypothetical protein
VGPEEGLLGDVLGLGGVPQHAEREPIDAVLLGTDELLERRAVARAEPVDELSRVARRRLSHPRRHPRAEPSAHEDARTS